MCAVCVRVCERESVYLERDALGSDDEMEDVKVRSLSHVCVVC